MTCIDFSDSDSQGSELDQRTVNFLDSINTLVVTGGKRESLRLDSESVYEPEIPVFDQGNAIAADLDSVSHSTVSTQSTLISQGDDDSSYGLIINSHSIVFTVSCQHLRRTKRITQQFLALISLNRLLSVNRIRVILLLFIVSLAQLVMKILFLLFLIHQEQVLISFYYQYSTHHEYVDVRLKLQFK